MKIQRIFLKGKADAKLKKSGKDAEVSAVTMDRQQNESRLSEVTVSWLPWEDRGRCLFFKYLKLRSSSRFFTDIKGGEKSVINRYYVYRHCF